jgi:hypothetical protein
MKMDEKVSVLPTSNAMEASAYKIFEKIGNLDYRIDMNGNLNLRHFMQKC